MGHSVWLNDVLIPIQAIESTVSLYTRSLFEANDDKTYPISLAGSCVAVKYRGRFLVLCTRHQLKGRKVENIALLTADGESSITSNGVRHFVDVNGTDYHDLVAFDFTAPCNALSYLKYQFFDWKEIPPDTSNDRVVCMIASGYAFDDQTYEMEDGRRLGQAVRIVLCQPVRPEPVDPALMRLRTLKPLDFNPDGMSGGGAFVIQLVDGEARAYFGGIVTRAGGSHIHVVRVGFVRQFVDTWLSMEADAKG